MTVTSLTPAQKQMIKLNYESKRMNIKQMAAALDVSTRTIGRVLDELGLAAPMAKRHGEAYQTMELLKRFGLNREQLGDFLQKLYDQDLIKMVEGRVVLSQPQPTVGAAMKLLSEISDDNYANALKDIIHLREAKKYNISVQGAMLKLERKAEANANDNKTAGS